LIISENKKLENQLKMCEDEITRLNLTTQSQSCPVCPVTYESDYNACIDRETTNDWFIYQ
jgi:hypothetical protein